VKPRTPDWLVERLHRGDLPPDEALEVRARLAAEDGLARLDALARDDAEILLAHPPGPALGEIRRRAGRAAAPRPFRRHLLLVAVPFAAAAAALVVVLRPPVPPPQDENTRVKGLSPHLVVHRRAAAEAETLSPNARARAGDVLQLSYVSAGRRYGVVVSVDGRGVVTRHFPGDGQAAAKLSRSGAVPLEHAYRLDDAPAFERFFLVTGGAPFAVEPVLDAVRRLAAAGQAREGTPALQAGLSWSDFVVEKTP
jgi:hypothetical protein